MTILQGYLYTDVAQAGTVTINYPAGFSPDSFDKAGAKACLLSVNSSLPDGSYSLAWGGSSVVVTNLSGVWKGGVSLFISVPDVVNGQGEIVRATTDLTGKMILTAGGVEISAGGSSSGKYKSHLTKAHLVNMSASNAAAGVQTMHQQMTVEAHYIAVQIGVINASTVGTGVSKLSISTAAVAGTCPIHGAGGESVSLNSAGTGQTAWVDVTFGGSATATVPISSGVPSADSDFGFVWSDIMPLASILRTDVVGGWPILNVRQEWADGANRTGVQMMPSNSVAGLNNFAFNTENYAAAPWGRLWRTRTQAVAGVTSKAAMTSAAVNENRAGLAIVIRYFLANEVLGKTIPIFGDSIDAGSVQAVLAGYGMHQFARNAVSTQQNPVELAMYANAGMAPGGWLARAKILTPYHAGDMAVIATNSINGLGSTTIPSTNWNANKIAVAQIKQLCLDNEIAILNRTLMPVDPAGTYKFGASDATVRHAANVAIAAAASSSNPVADVSAVSEGPVDGTGQYTFPLVETNDTNRAHPSYEHAAIGGAVLAPYYK